MYLTLLVFYTAVPCTEYETCFQISVTYFSTSNREYRWQRASLKTCVTRKQRMTNFAKNLHFLPPDTHMYVWLSGDKKCLFFKQFGVLCFLVKPVLRFALLPYYRQYNIT